MIYIIMALYPEAQPLIEALQLKRMKTNEIYDSFQDEECGIKLVLTGAGKVRAAVAVSHICTKYQVGEEDFVLHIGSCAGKEIGELYLGNQIQDYETGRYFYPDILFRHDLRERAIVTVEKVLEDGLPEPSLLYDMEASGVYQGCVPYLGQHQMAFLKVVSDAGKGGNVTPQKLRGLIEQNIPEIAAFISCIHGYVDSFRDNKPNDAEIQSREKLCQAIHCSAAMRIQLEQLLRYFWLTGRDYHAVIEEDFRLNRLPCKDRKEGKKYLEELKRRLL